VPLMSSSAKGCSSIAYTYTEPTVFFEFAMDTAKLAKTEGLKNVFVTNGYMTAEALDMATPCLDAANVDLKAFSDDFYKNYCGASLDPVKATLKRLKAIKGGIVGLLRDNNRPHRHAHVYGTLLHRCGIYVRAPCRRPAALRLTVPL